MNSRRPISEILEEHAARLMALDGVAGVYEGTLATGEPCVVVMLKHDSASRREDIPGVLDGYPVRLEFGGEIRPME